jgi:hypothetical protein
MTVDADHFPARFRQQQFLSLRWRANSGRAAFAAVLCSGWNLSLAQVFVHKDDCE